MESGGTPYSSSMAPSGSYILIVVSQPVTEDHKKLILERLNKGLLSWDVESTGCDLSGLETVCSGISPKHLNDSDVLIQHSTESLGVEVLISPTVSTLKQCVKNLFSTATGHKHLIHAGYTFAGSGSWILQNGTFSFDEFLEIFQQADVQSQKLCNIHVHCPEIGSWNSSSLSKDIFAKVANVSFNPPEKVSHVPGSEYLSDCISRVISPQALEDIMEASTLVGNIRFNRPTLYMFPAGQGDCALFGINGFNMLIDGGFNRKPCSWEFIRHLDRLDAVLVTRLCENNVCGMSTLMKRKSLNNTYPQIGYVFCNIAENKALSPKEALLKNKDDLVVSVVQEGHNFTETLNELKLKPHQCWRDSSVEPFVLYHKVGHGTLEMHVLSPPKDSKEMKAFLTEWSSYKETFSYMKTGKGLESAIPLSHATSICAVLIWRPADPKDTITRILFPGSAPQSKIFESLEKLKNLDVLKQPVVTKASLSVVVTKTANNVEKLASRTSIPNRKNTASPALSVSSNASRNGDIGGVKKEIKKVVKEVKKDNKDIKKDVKDSVTKEVKKTQPVPKKDSIAKRESVLKDAKKDNKDIKTTIKKDTKAVIDKKSELKSAPRKSETTTVTKAIGEVKKTATTTVKKSTSAPKKDVAKSSPAQKASEVKKSSISKVSELKSSKDISNKKTAEVKGVAKTKPKATSAAGKPSTKAKPIEPKTSIKVTKAVAASSIVASAVAVTAAALEINEKKEEIVDTEPEKELGILDNMKDVAAAEKSEEVNVSPLPPEAVSPTPSESVSLTPSDTLSSAPLETVSPTPPLANEPASMEEKEVNEMKDIDQDLPYETEKMTATTDDVGKDQYVEEEENEIELELARRQQNADAMSTSFMGIQDLEPEIPITSTESTEQFGAGSIRNNSNNYLDEDGGNENERYEEEPNQEVVEKEYGVELEANEKNVDDQLAQMSMEGSFIAGVAYGHESSSFGNVGSHSIASGMKETMGDELLDKPDEYEKESSHEYGHVRNESPKLEAEEKIDYSAERESGDVDQSYLNENNETLGMDEYAKSLQITDEVLKNSSTDIQADATEMNDKYTTEIQEKEVSDEKYIASYEPEMTKEYAYENEYSKYQESETIAQSMAFKAEENDYDISRNIIEDSEMQETSVDEPEEILRKESAVSITLNDDESGIDYDDEMRRKSCAESEDDVDIQNYMTNEQTDFLDHDKLDTRRGADSDNEDVVKSPTPHAIVDYEGQMDNITHETGSSFPKNDEIGDIKDTLRLTEKQDLNEKDRDSAEEQYQEDEDDGEMIRHPTPPDMKRYSEEEMRDPIGPHYITGPGLKSQVSGITEEPLYEESEDAGSERSVSPVVEQPVFGNVVEADFPELVTVSGGTTPSEPQSPKTGFEAKRFVSENAVMDALSEHDISESSTHSPLYNDGSSAFEMPSGDENILGIRKEEIASDLEDTKENVTGEMLKTLDNASTKFDDEKLQLGSQDAHSDDESYSQNDKSETRSEKSDGDDEKSDMRRDDPSDHQYDNKSDVMDDDKSDSHYEDKHEEYDDKTEGSYGLDGTRSHQFSSAQDQPETTAKYGMEYENYQFNESDYRPPIHKDDVIQYGHHGVSDYTQFSENYGSQEVKEDLFSRDIVSDSTQNDFGYSESNELSGADKMNITSEFKAYEYSEKILEAQDNTKNATQAIQNFSIPPLDEDMSTKHVSNSLLEENLMDSDASNRVLSKGLKDLDNFNTLEEFGNPSTKYDQHEYHTHLEQERYEIGSHGNSSYDDIGSKTTTYEHTTDNSILNNESIEHHSVDVHSVDDISPPHTENVSGFENKILSEMAEAHQDESLSKFEENDHTSNITYNESRTTNTVLKNAEQRLYEEEKNYHFDSNDTEYSTEGNTFERAEETKNDLDVQRLNKDMFSHPNTSGFSGSEHSETYNYSSNNAGFVPTEPGNFENGPGTGEDHNLSSYTSSVTKSETFQEVGPSEIELEGPITDNLGMEPASQSSFGKFNGKEEASWGHSVSDYSKSHLTDTNTEGTVGYATTEQESTYIINSRFHSDSPEDNIMRSDSSPDVPPYPLDSTGKVPDFRNSMADSNKIQDEYSNINLPNIPLSPSKTHKLKEEYRYGESSEDDEDSSSIPGTVSPYAYTNKAYSKEEEDVDGNTIYKESVENTTVIKEFDANNPPAISTQQKGYSQETSNTGETNYDFRLEEWGKPMGLPTPVEKTAAKKSDRASGVKALNKSSADTNGKAYSPSISKMSSPMKKPKATKESSSSQVYVDLAYVPHHGDPQYCDVEFFKKIRARYYVFSGINPSKEVLNALLEAKKSWKEDLEVTIIPTYETDTLGYWMAQNQDDLAKYSIEVAPSASRCTVNLQDHETSCAAYRLEF